MLTLIEELIKLVPGENSLFVMCSPLLLIVVIWLSRFSIGSSGKEKALFRTSLIISLVVGLLGLKEVSISIFGWEICTLPFFFAKWMFLSFSVIWPIIVFAQLSRQKETVRMASIIVFLGITGFVVGPIMKHTDVKQMKSDKEYWESFFEKNDINRPQAELKSRLSKIGLNTLEDQIHNRHPTTVESLEIVFNMCREIVDDIKKSHPREQDFANNRDLYLLRGGCKHVLSEISYNPNINLDFIEKHLLVTEEDGSFVYANGLAYNESTPPDILVRLSYMSNAPLDFLSRNSMTPREIIEVMSSDEEAVDGIFARIKNEARKKHLSKEYVDNLVNIREQLNKNRSGKEVIQKGAERTLKRLNEEDKAEEIIRSAIQKLIRTKELVDATNFIYENGINNNSSMRLRERVYFGMLRCMSGRYEEAKNAYSNAEHEASCYGEYNKEYLPQYITTLLLSRKGAPDALVAKMSAWYPDDAKIQRFVKLYPYLKEELAKFAVDNYRHPDKAPESMEPFLSFKVFE